MLQRRTDSAALKSKDPIARTAIDEETILSDDLMTH
jgi:hypothetical protein